MPLIVPSGRVYAIYTYNGDEVRSLPGSKRQIRSDMLGWYCFKYSDDAGKTWRMSGLAGAARAAPLCADRWRVLIETRDELRARSS